MFSDRQSFGEISLQFCCQFKPGALPCLQIVLGADSITRMQTDRYHQTFKRLARKGEGAFVPFSVLGDPDPEISLTTLRALVEGGADMLELGFPFSDPVADGPVIQGADHRALQAGVNSPVVFEILETFRGEYPEIPVGLLLYANLIHRPGPESFYKDAGRAGVDSSLVADLPHEESADFVTASRKAGVEPVFLVTPNTGPQRLASILSMGGPYLYTVTRKGVTGSDTRLASSAAPLVKRIRAVSDIPILLGFGIGEPEHVQQALAAGADGAISGSAVVKIIERHVTAGLRSRKRVQELAKEIRDFARSMKRATIR
jgi:tryptophan synthase alpha chain